MFTNLAHSAARKKTTTCQKRPFLIVFTASLDSSMTSQNAINGQDEKTMHMPVSNTLSSFQSEYIKRHKEKILNFKSGRLDWKVRNCKTRIRHKLPILPVFQRTPYDRNPTNSLREKQLQEKTRVKSL